MMLVNLLLYIPFIAKTTLLKNLGNILELISNYTQTHISDHQQEKNDETQCF
jgi:hypothetical protein